MIVTTNFTNSEADVTRYPDGAALRDFVRGHGLDGLELMPVGGFELGYIPPELVIGVHLPCLTSWVDFWRGDEAALIGEFGSLETVRQVFGGDRPADMLAPLREGMALAKRVGARYVVFHISNVTLSEAASYRPVHTDEEVCAAAAEVINAVADPEIEFLAENLWWPGLTFLRPEVTRELMEAVRAPRKGIVLDAGHLMHTNLDLSAQREAVEYIHRRLDAHGPLCRYIRGLHLHQSLTGDYVRRMLAQGVALTGDYWRDFGNFFPHVFNIDRHEPFDIPEARGLVERLAPEYLTHEFITESSARHSAFLRTQMKALGRF